MSSSEVTTSGGSSGRRILSRPKPVDENNHQQPKTETKPTQQKSANIKELKETNGESNAHQTVHQQQISTNYINKEPFNEDLEIEECSFVEDLKWRDLIIDKLKEVVGEIKTLSADQTQKNVIREKYKKGLLLCSTIKKLNRVSHMRVNKARNKTHEEKNKIDEHHLELQNLLYEISHLQQEINKCHEFRSLHQDINLVSVDEFYANAPLEISNKEVTEFNEHKLQLARLDWELMERQNMTGKIKELESQIEQREHELKAKQLKLESLHPKLNQIIESCKPTLDYFNTNFSESCVFSEPVQYLPKPLYQFYMMLTAYKDTIDKETQIEVCGDLEEARRFNLNETILLDDEESDSDEDAENENYKKKKSKSKISKKKLNNREKLFACFPLTCKTTLKIKNFGSLTLEFKYLNMLKIVCVKIDYEISKGFSLSDESFLSTETLLDCIYPNDDGKESPSLSNKFLFSSLGIRSIESHLRHVGRPYRWCQMLCGLFYETKADRESMLSADRIGASANKESHNDPDKPVHEEMEVNRNNSSGVMEVEDEESQATESQSADDSAELNEAKLFEQIINRLKARFKSRVVIQETINSLKNCMPPKLETEKQGFKIQSVITSCKETSFEKFASHAFTKHLRESLINENDCFFYELTLKNSNAVLSAQIVISHFYPRVTPLFCINIDWKHERNYFNDEAIRDIERELNILHDNFLSLDLEANQAKIARKSQITKHDERNYDLLARQVNHLLLCFDVYLDSESYYLKDNEHQRSKLFTQSVRGRDRKRPYSYLSSKDIFIQRMKYELAGDESSSARFSESVKND